MVRPRRMAPLIAMQGRYDREGEWASTHMIVFEASRVPCIVGSGSTGSGRDTRPCGIGFVCKLAKPTQEAGADRFGVVCRVPGEEGQFDASRVRREASAVWRSKQGHVTIRFTVTVIRLRGAGPSHRRLAFVLHGFQMACREWGGRALLTDKGQGRVAHIAN